MSIALKVVHDGARNASVQITGQGCCDWCAVVDLDKLDPRPVEVRLDAVYYAVSDQMEVQLAWCVGDSGRFPFLPISGRGKVDFSEVSGIHNNAAKKTGHIELRCIGDNLDGIYTIVLDLSKHLGVQHG